MMAIYPFHILLDDRPGIRCVTCVMRRGGRCSLLRLGAVAALRHLKEENCKRDGCGKAQGITLEGNANCRRDMWRNMVMVPAET